MAIRLKAIRQLCGDYGTVAPGQEFNADPDTALSLQSRGLAEEVRCDLPAPAEMSPVPAAFLPPENKMLVPEEVKEPEPVAFVQADTEVDTAPRRRGRPRKIR